MTEQTNESGAVRYYWHGETFWRDLIARQAKSGQGVRKFCNANGVQHSTFHKWRAALVNCGEIGAPAAVTTPDAMFIPIVADSAAVTNLPAPEAMPYQSLKTSSRDSVVVSSGGVRVELTGAHADRIVRHLLGRLGGFTC